MKQSFFVVVMIISIGFSSCIEPVYIPNKISIPMFRREKQFYANVAYVDDSGPTLNTAYSVIDPIYVGAGFNSQDKLKPFKQSFKTSFYYGELGYYYWLSQKVETEFSAGYGIGSSETYDEFGDSASRYYDHNDVKYYRFHIQPSLCFSIPLTGGEHQDPWRDVILELALSARLSVLNTTRYAVTHYARDNTTIDSTGTKSYKQAFIEPAITVRIGVEHLMLEAQAGSSYYFDQSYSIFGEVGIPHKDKFLSLGLVSRF